MKRKLFFITLLMLFCSTMFGQHWTMTNQGDYTLPMTVYANVSINGEAIDGTGYELAAFNSGELRGVACPEFNALLGQYIVTLTVYGKNIGDEISFKLFDSSINKELETNFTVGFRNDPVGQPLFPEPIYFYEPHWSFNAPSSVENYMGFGCAIKIDGVEQNRPNLELAAFKANGELCGVARPQALVGTDLYIVDLPIYASNGETISFKLFDPTVGENGAELTTDYTIVCDVNYDSEGNVEYIDFKNNAVAKIGNSYFSTLEAALNAATENCTIDILTDITITADWDCRNAKITKTAIINGNDNTIKFTGKISDGYNHLAAFRFEAPVTVKSLVIDMSEAEAVFQNRFSAISTKANLTVDDCKFIGSTTYASSRAIIYGEGGYEGLEVTVTDTEFINWKYGVVDNMNGNDVKSVTIANNTFTNADVQISANENVTFTGNKTDSDVQITSYTANNTLNVTAIGNTLATDGTYTVNAGGTLNLQDEFLTPVASINGKIYFDLQAAIDAATEGQIVTVIGDIVLGENDGIVVAEGKNIILDLNGKTISQVKTQTTEHSMLVNLGVLTIEDSSADKLGKISYTDNGNGGEYVSNTISNYNTLTINGGTIENLSSKALASAGYPHAIDNNLYYNKKNVERDVKLVINGGTISNEYYSAIRLFCNSTVYENITEINGGTIVNAIDFQLPNANKLLGRLTITAGEFETKNGKTASVRMFAAGNANDGSGMIASIKGGNFKGSIGGISVLPVPASYNTKIVTGGTFTTDVTDYCAPGFACTQNAQGSYSVTFADYITLPTDVTVENYEEKFGTNTVTDGTNYYPTLQAAVESVTGQADAILYCKPGADVGSLQHAPVTNTLTVYGNDAYVSGDTERDFDLGNTDPNGGKDIEADMTLTVKHLDGCGAWGTKATEHTVNLVFENCDNMGKVFITGQTGTLNISMTNCAFEGVISEAVYSNADGAITLTNVAFSNLNKAVNLNHKAAGTQTVIMTECTFTDCGKDVSTDQIPVRVLSSVDGGKSELSVYGCTFTGTPEGGADILLDYGVGLTTATVSNTAAKVMVERESNVPETTDVAANETKSFNNKPYVAMIEGQGFTTIAEALAATTDGATVTIIASTNETIGVPAGNNVTITAAEGVELSGGVGGSYYNKSVTFDGLTFKGGKGMALTASVEGLTYTVKNCTFDGVQATAYKQGVISLNGKATVVVENNTITNVQNATEGDGRIESLGQQSTGIYTSEAASVTITGNTISGVDGTGINPNATIGKVTITDNTISNWGTGATAKNEGRAIRTSGGTEVAITGNVMIDNGTAKEEFVKATGITTSLDASGNYWNGNSPLTEGMFDTDLAGDPAIILNSYYTDKDKTQLVTLSASVAKIGEEYYQSLQAAIDACKVGDNTITFIANINETVTVLQKEGINITIDGKKDAAENYQFTGTINIYGNARHDKEETLTIQNVDFYTENLTHNFIYADETGGVKSYAHNVTVKDCNFSTTESNAANPNNAVVALRIRQGYDITVEGVIVNGLHSLMQLSGCNGVIVEDVTLNALSGINLQNVYNVDVKDNTFVVVDHAIRVGANSGDILSDVGPVKVEGNNFTSTGSEDAVIVVRHTCSSIDLEITNNSIVGETHISVPQETFTGSISADANYWGENKTAPTVTGTSVDIYSYYKDAERTQLVVVAMTFEEFVNKVIEGNGTYNGLTSENKNVKVVLEPTSGDAREQGVANTVPNRLQKYSNPEVYYAQYQRFSTLADVNVSNVDFVFIPKAVTVVDAWNTSGATTTVDNINGELQLMNSGSVTFTNCSFDMMSISPINATALTVTECAFKGLDAYAIKDVKANNVTITETEFDECNGGFWFNAAPQTITVTDNTFTNVGRRGAIQFSAAGDYTNTEMTITENTVDGAFLWQLNNTVTYEQISAILDTEKNTYTTAYVEGSLGFVAKVGDNYYFTIQAAITAAGTAETNVSVIANSTENVTIQEGANIVLNFAENVELVGTILAPNADLTINGGIIRNTDSSKSGIQVNAGELTLNNVEITSARHALRLEGTNGEVVAIINGGTYKLHEVTSQTQHVLNAGGDGEQVIVSILGGTFVGPRGTISDSGSAVNAQTNANVTIEGGDFSGGKNNTLSSKGTLTVKGGTFDQDPSAYLAEGYLCGFDDEAQRYNVFMGVASLTQNETTTYYATLAEAIAEIGAGDVVINLHANATLNYDARETYGTAETTSVTINGNGNILALHQTNTDWSSLGLANENAKFVFNNMTVNKTKAGGNNSWNNYAIIFSSEVEMTDVIVNNSMAVQDGATLNNVTINEANGYYGLWINGNGQSVTMNGGSITATNGGRGIKVADEYVDEVKQVTLNVTGTKFNTAKKAAVLVSSTAGAKVTANDCDITNVAEDNVNFVWVDEDWAAYYNSVKVYDDATKTQENEESFPIKVWYVNDNGAKSSIRAYYKTLDALFAAPATQVPASNYIDLRGNVEATNKVDVNYGSNRVYTFGTEVEGGVTMEFKYAENWNKLPKFDLGQNITLNVPYLQVIGGDISIAGTLNTGYLYLYGTGEGVVIEETGVVNANVSNDKTVQVKGGTVLTVKGKLNTSTLNVWTEDVNNSKLIVSGTGASVTASHIHAWNGKDGVSSQEIVVENGATLTAKNLQADRGSIVTVDAATLTATTLTLGYEGNVGTLVVNNNGVVTNGVVISSIGSTVTGPESLTVTSGVEGYGVNYYNGVYSLVVIETQKTQLYQGWNWFSSYININGAEGLDKLQAALDGNATLMKSHTAFGAYHDGSWYNNGGAGLNAASVTEMYMIDMKNDFELQLEGNLVNPEEHTIQLAKQWNWIGYPSNEAQNLATAFGATPQHGDQIKSHVGFSQYYAEGSNDFGITGWWGTLNNMTPGLGYMYYRNGEATSFTYNVPAEGSRSELKANVTAENNYWVPTSYQYANNMTMIAMVEGLNDGNYEIAAFINGEVRGSARPIYVEPLDAYMFFLTIHGDEVEEMTFRCYELATGEEYAISDRINYSVNAMLGSIEEPYILRGTVGISDNTAAEINIYPNPTTTGREINLETICETVEVYNALGVKIAEYHNVDTIDALETAGIYVIRVTTDGNARNYRLVVK